jgi:hypothetical protein
MRLTRPVNRCFVIGLFLIAGLFGGGALAHAQSFCFLSAGSYYEQVYCELQARGQTQGLPPFHQFKRNDEVIQAAILKRPAQRNGIKLPAPQTPTASTAAPAALTFNASAPNASAPNPKTPSPKTPSASTPSTSPSSVLAVPTAETAVQRLEQSSSPFAVATADPNTCRLEQQHIDCDAVRYQLVGNRANRALAAEALTDANRMALPRFQSEDEPAQIQNYLRHSYRTYLSKMHEIGLAGATLSYDKFAFLFFDVRSKGLDFSQRFETMYTYLKRDKKNMGVSEKLSLDELLQISDCIAVADDFMVCSRAGRNYLFIAGS